VLIDHSNEPMMRLLINKTRTAELSGPALAEAHRDVGKQLAGSIAQHVQLEEIAIHHVAGASTGVQIKPGSEPIIVALMRAGLFVAEGIWSRFPGSSLALHGYRTPLGSLPAKDRSLVIVDSVINTGKTIREMICATKSLQPANIVVAALVAYRPNLEMLLNEFPDVHFHIARISDRSYIGRGSTDTGARLFGTTTWKCEY
jgi:uracil phosphoribosyltransferase